MNNRIVLIVATLWLCSACHTGTRASDDDLIVRLDSVLSVLSPHPVGVNVNYLMDGGRFPEAKHSLEEALREMGIRYARFPGGEKSDLHMFSPPPYDRPCTSLSRTVGLDDYPGMFTSNGQYVFPPLSFDEFIDVCHRAGIEPVITVPADGYLIPAPKGKRITGRDELIRHAAAWVKYANIEKGYGVKYWMIGNESWNSNNIGSSPEIYAHDVVAFSRAMKAVDPSIFIIPNGDSEEFFETVLQTGGDDIDLLCVSNYGIYDFTEGYKSYEEEEKCLIWPALTALKSLEEYASPAQKERLRLIVAEFGPIDWFGHWPEENDMGHAIVAFDMAGQLLQTSGIVFSCFWNTRWIDNDRFNRDYDAIDPDGNLRPTGISLKIWNDFSGNEMLAVHGPRNMPAFACRDSIEKKIYLYVINKTGSERSVHPVVPSAKRCGAWVYYGSSPEDTAPVWESFKTFGNGPVQLRPYSINILEFSYK